MTRRRASGRGRWRKAAPGLPAGVQVALFVLRLWTGAFFLVTGWWKLVQAEWTVAEKIAWFRDHEYVPLIEGAIENPPRVLGVTLEPFAAFLQHVMLPGAGVFAPLILFFEVLLGVTLVLGLGVRLFAGLGFLMMLAFTLVKPQPDAPPGEEVGVFLFTVHSANWPATLVLLGLCLAAAGRVLGLDAWLRDRAPPWLRWTT